ncbi:hypothetical protein MYX76_15970 [Desulfobacterota bacterium AH_259_B03_O07]|nr:hypothetical protein [Desulfobacterota bacterium AH_259_B03_O07]
MTPFEELEIKLPPLHEITEHIDTIGDGIEIRLPKKGKVVYAIKRIPSRVSKKEKKVVLERCIGLAKEYCLFIMHAE